MNNLEKYADLDLPLVPGEKVAYITEGADIVHRALIIATNKRLLLVKRGIVPAYTSLFYNTISLVHFKGGLLMHAVILKLNGTGEIRVIRTRSNITAKSLFSILSNRVIIDHDIAMTYKAVDEIAGLDHAFNSSIKEGRTGILNANMVEVVDRIEEANGAFAEMVRMVENNVLKSAEARKAASRELNAERIESLKAMVRGASKSALNTAAVFSNYKKPQSVLNWIDFESAAKRLEKISISDRYDPNMFVPQSTSSFVAANPGLGVISARIEGMQHTDAKLEAAEAQAPHEVGISNAISINEAAADQQHADFIAASVESTGTKRQDELIRSMNIFKIRSARENLANM